MVLLAKIIGIVVLTAGVVVFMTPVSMKKVLDLVLVGNRVYAVAAVRVTVGILLLASARECSIPWLVAVIGMIPLLAGAVMLYLGAEKVKSFIGIIKEKPEGLIRRVVLVPIMIGVLLLIGA
ncbi:MAG: hypothetical protein PHT95_01680 [Candidatus Omnitrophica bacterium]|nr:hypothetical protein [Candidatus Omnitrophota bacterium]MDD4012594.1 hypothetical protein [Candidatus Omnitrophota bacterium]